VSDALLRGDPQAIEALDRVIKERVLGDPSIARVKIWARPGRIVYSDEPRLIGALYPMSREELAELRVSRVDAHVSDLAKPENRFEQRFGRLLEVYMPIRTPSGEPLRYEVYYRSSFISARGSRIFGLFAPVMLGALVLLALIQLPLAWRLATRVRKGQEEQQRLLKHALEASELERRRIAHDLHDGVVQDLAGVAFGLAPLVEEAERRGDQAEAAALRDASVTLRQGVRDLRTLLVEIHPPNLESAGLEVALSDLLSPLAAAGIATELHVDDAAAPGSEHDVLVYRAAREAVRNAQAHGKPSSVRVELARQPGRTRLVVSDDGRGFTPADRERRVAEGHVGLRLVESLVEQSGGRLSVASEPGEGTTVVLEVPSA
jgi:signal transduction histidine kinase